MRTGELRRHGLGPRAGAPRRPARGYTYIFVLLAVAVMAAGGAAVAEIWATHAQREREAELLFVGEQFRRAIGAYFESTPGSARQYPRSFEDMLRDARYPVPRRYLRRIYLDPMTGSPEWGIVRAPDGGIAGVHSTARSPTLKKSGFASTHAAFEGASTHAEWQFIYAPGTAATVRTSEVISPPPIDLMRPGLPGTDMSAPTTLPVAPATPAPR